MVDIWKLFLISYLNFLYVHNIRGHSNSTYALRGREGVRVKATIYCFYDVFLLFKNERRGGVLKSPNLSIHTFWMVSIECSYNRKHRLVTFLPIKCVYSIEILIIYCKWSLWRTDDFNWLPVELAQWKLH